MDTNTLASRLNVSPKTLRRRIRDIGTFEKVDGQYYFTEADVAFLQDTFIQPDNELVERLDLNVSEPLDTSILHNYWSNTASRRTVKKKWEERQARLRAELAKIA